MTAAPLLAETATPHTGWLTGVLLEAVRGGAEWILWILVVLSVLSFVVLVERLLFYRASRADSEALRGMITERVGAGDIDGARQHVADGRSMQERVLAYGLRETDRGPEAVLELCKGAVGTEKLRYERGLAILATIGSNAPFIGLFGTVIGVIMAFDQLRGLEQSGGTPSAGVMGAIAEALIATGVGLLVAIPAIIFYNILKSHVRKVTSQTELLVQTMTALLHPDRGEG